jgi:hypothetical protein
MQVRILVDDEIGAPPDRERNLVDSDTLAAEVDPQLGPPVRHEATVAVAAGSEQCRAKGEVSPFLTAPAILTVEAMTNNSPSSSTPARSTPGWVLPAVVCAAAVVAGVGLLVMGGQNDRGSSTSEPPPDTANGFPDGSTAASTDSTTAPTGAPASTVDSELIPGPGQVVIDGVLYTSQHSCVHFPNSNPAAGVGDGHVNTTLHRLVAVRASTDEPFVQVIAELQRFDADQALRLDFLGGPAGQATYSGTIAAAGDIAVGLDDGTTVVLSGDLDGASNACGNVLIQSATDEFVFASLGYIAACNTFDAGDVTGVAYMNDGNIMARGGRFEGDTFVDTFTYLPVDGSSVEVNDVVYDLNGAEQPVHRGTASPGPLSDNDTFTIQLVGFEGGDVAFVETPCTEAQLSELERRLG